jgi:hypothetical protein
MADEDQLGHRGSEKGNRERPPLAAIPWLGKGGALRCIERTALGFAAPQVLAQLSGKPLLSARFGGSVVIHLQTVPRSGRPLKLCA